MAKLPDNSVLIAHKAIGLAPGYTGDTRRVATAILDHYNHKTRRCDPSNERIAALLGISVRMVSKATKELCGGSAPLFKKKSHAGHAHCASYEPQWQTFRSVVETWNAAMIGDKSDGSNRNNRAGSTGTTVPVQQEQPCVQTRRMNQTNEPLQVPPSSADPSPANRNGRKGLGKQAPRDGRQGHLVYAITGGKEPSRSDAAEAARYRRLTAEIERLPKHERAAAWLAAGGEAIQ